MTSCEKDEVKESNKDDIENSGDGDNQEEEPDDTGMFTASMEALVPSTEGITVPEGFEWEAGDKIMIFACKDGTYQTGVEYKTKDSGASAKFSPSVEGTDVPEDADHYLAVFPADGVLVSPEGEISGRDSRCPGYKNDKCLCQPLTYACRGEVYGQGDPVQADLCRCLPYGKGSFIGFSGQHGICAEIRQGDCRYGHGRILGRRDSADSLCNRKFRMRFLKERQGSS